MANNSPPLYLGSLYDRYDSIMETDQNDLPIETTKDGKLAVNADVKFEGNITCSKNITHYAEAADTTNTDFGNVQIRRDINQSGGTPGFVNSALRVDTHAQNKDQTSFEWATCSVMWNSSAGGENLGLYAQGNKLLTTDNAPAGPTWAACLEAVDRTGISNPGTQLVGCEIDCRANGTDNNNTRVVCDLVHTGKDGSGNSEVFCGLRVQNAGISTCSVKRAINIATKCDVGLDFTGATVNKSAIKLPTSSPIHFDTDSTKALYYDTTGLGLMYRTTDNGTLNVRNGFMDNGSVLASYTSGSTTKSVRYGGNFGTGTGTAVLGSNKPGTAANLAPTTWIDVVIDGVTYCIPIWAKT